MFSAWRPVHNVHTDIVFLFLTSSVCERGWEKMTSVGTWMHCGRHRERGAVMSGADLVAGGFNDGVV